MHSTRTTPKATESPGTQLVLPFGGRPQEETQEVVYGEIPRYRVRLVRESSSSWRSVASLQQPWEVVSFLEERVCDSPTEQLGALYVDTHGRPIGWHIAASGTLASAPATPRALLVPALLCNAASLIAFHNHPSGDPEPSYQDLVFTERLREACNLLGSTLLDHLVLGEPGFWVSIRDRQGW